MKRTLTLWKVFMSIMTLSVVGTIVKYSLDLSASSTRSVYIAVTQGPIIFDARLSRAHTMKKIANITVRHMKNGWSYADDVCYTGVVFPSFYLTSTLANTTMYANNEIELHMTLEKLRPGSWFRRNLDLLLEGINRLGNASFIDIYAGRGMYSLPVARLGRNVIALEYRYTYAERLCRGILAGQFRGKATIVNNMLSNVTQVVKLPHYHSGEKSRRDLNVTDDVFKQVSSIQLSSLLNRFVIKEAVLKIDMDRDVIQAVLSSDRFFDQVKIHFVLMEWSGPLKTEFKNSVIAFFTKHNLLPCDTPNCPYQLQESTTIWPAYIWWVNKARVPWYHRSLVE